MKYTTGWMVITPEIAKDMLKHNTDNYRKIINSHVVRAYATDMKAGLWKANGEAITFSKSGVLKNGQHRLLAIIKAGVSAKIFVITDVDDDVDIYDEGYKRNIKQRGRRKGYAFTSLGTGLVTIVYNGGIKKGKIPQASIQQYYEDNYETVKLAESIVSTFGNTGRNCQCASVVYCMLRSNQMPENELRDFFRVVNSGVVESTSRESSSALVLRRQFETMKRMHCVVPSKRLELTIKALNDFHSQHSRKRDYTDDTKMAENLINRIQVIDKFSYNNFVSNN